MEVFVKSTRRQDARPLRLIYEDMVLTSEACDAMMIDVTTRSLIDKAKNSCTRDGLFSFECVDKMTLKIGACSAPVYHHPSFEVW